MRAQPGAAGKASAAFPGRVVAYTAALGALLVALAVAGARTHSPAGVPWTSLLPFLALLTAAESLLVRVHIRNQVLAITLFEAALAPVLFSSPVLAVIGVVFAAEAITGFIRRNHPVKHAFNMMQFASAAAIGSLLFHALRQGAGASPRNLLALAIAMTAVAAANIVTLSSVITLAEGAPYVSVLRKLAPAMLFGWTVNTTFGVLFAAAYALSQWTIPLFAVPMILLYTAYKGHATAIADRARLAGMHRASRALAGPVDPRDAIPQFLVAVRECFDAGEAQLVLREGDVRVVHSVNADGSSYTENSRWSSDPFAITLLAARQGTIVRTADDGVSAAWLRAAGHHSCIAAPLVEGDRPLGVLRVYDIGGPEGFEQGGLAVLESLAVEATRAMIKSELLETILAEQQKMSEIIGRTSDGIATLSAGGQVQTWNTALERITGYSAEEMAGPAGLTDILLRDAGGDHVPLSHWAESAEALPTEVQVSTPSGESRWLSCSYTRVTDADGEPAMLIVVARDSTEAREVERLKDDFVATVSHELRTPLTPIKGWAATMLQIGDRLEPAQREEGVKAIMRHADRLEQLITNILEVTKIERGMLDRRDDLVEVPSVVDKVVNDFRSTYPTRTIITTVDGQDLRTRGDELWTEQIVTNLVSNALKYAPANEPVEVEVRRNGERVEVNVTDRGPGIAAHEAELIFERFKRLGDHMTRTTSGSGLGLYIARQLARAVGGELSVTSSPGVGATFSLSLPAAVRSKTLSVAS